MAEKQSWMREHPVCTTVLLIVGLLIVSGTTLSLVTPRIETVTQYVDVPVEVEKEAIKYQCFDGSVQTDKKLCPGTLVEKKLSKQVFEGTEDKVISNIYLKEGYAKITGHYVGDSNFAVKLLGGAGKYELLFNEIGAYDGETIVYVRESGYYILEVEANSWDTRVGWKIIVEQ